MTPAETLAEHPGSRRIELFARDHDYEGDPKVRFVSDWKDGFDAWGNELNRRAS